MITFAGRITLVTCVGVLLIAAPVHAQDTVAAARELYAAARYDEALKSLDRLSTTASSNDERQTIDLYRTLCLIAVGRRDDANRAIEAIIDRDPLYQIADDLPPRTRTAFSDVKKRVLPTIVQRQYTEAKVAFDRKDFEAAAITFKRVNDALNDPEIRLAAQQPPLSDLRTLAAGFYDLSVKAIPPEPAPLPPPAPATATVNRAPRIYTADESGVRPAVTIAQELPRYPGPVPASGLRGAIEVIIDEKGTVESATMVTPVSASYDKLVLAAASRWQFSPALANGAPVKYRKRIQINIAQPTR